MWSDGGRKLTVLMVFCFTFARRQEPMNKCEPRPARNSKKIRSSQTEQGRSSIPPEICTRFWAQKGGMRNGCQRLSQSAHLHRHTRVTVAWWLIMKVLHFQLPAPHWLLCRCDFSEFWFNVGSWATNKILSANTTKKHKLQSGTVSLSVPSLVLCITLCTWLFRVCRVRISSPSWRGRAMLTQQAWSVWRLPPHKLHEPG